MSSLPPPLIFANACIALARQRPLRLVARTTCRSPNLTQLVDCRSSGLSPEHRRPSTKNICHFSSSRSSSSSSNSSKKKNKRSTSDAVSGRIVLREQGKKRKSNAPKLCAGCGTEVVSDNEQNMGMTAGTNALDLSVVGKKQQKKARYFDPLDNPTANNFLCHRCKVLKDGNIWKAYDALRDVSPKVFMDQLSYIVNRRKFGLCVMVVDATDPEHTAVKNLRRAIGKMQTILVVNKVDLLPSLGPRDTAHLVHQIEKISTRFTDYYFCSSVTGQGVFELAQGLLSQVGGRDVFVVGTANVGKSSLVKRLSALIADALRLKGTARQAHRRRDLMHDLKVTGSSLPGTTLQAVRVPCFPSMHHALWDTPGIINQKALQYCIFPSHLMEPLVRPGPIPVPSRENKRVFRLRADRSILVEAPWMEERDEDLEENPTERIQPCVLARIDLISDDPMQAVDTRAFVHPALRVRVVSTAVAPTEVNIPPSHIQRIKKRIAAATENKETGLADSYSLPLQPFSTKENPDGMQDPPKQGGSHATMDISFPGLGWIAFLDKSSYRVKPYCVRGSVFSKRRSLYPVNLANILEESGATRETHEVDALDDGRVRELREAYEEGKKNRQERKTSRHDGDNVYYDALDDDEYW